MADFKKQFADFMEKFAAKKDGSGTPALPPPASEDKKVAITLSFPKDVKKRWLLIGVVAAVGIAVVGSMASSKPTQAPRRIANGKADEKMVDITPKGLDKKSWQAQSMLEIEQLKQTVGKQAKDNSALVERLENIVERQNQLEKLRAQEAKDAKTNAHNPGLAYPSGVTPPPVPPNSLQSRAGATLQQPVTPGTVGPGITLPSSQSANGLGSSSPVPAGLPPMPAAMPQAEPTLSRPEPVKKTSALDALGQKVTDVADAAVKVSSNYVPSSHAGMLPPGSFADIALLHGLDAATGSVAQANPQPILLNVLEHATLPGAAKYQLKSCFVLGSAFGDLSSERIYIQLAKLSCVDKADKLILSSDVQGYVVDSDGRLGLRGVLTDRQGSRLAKAALAGFAQGLANALKSSVGSVSTSPLGAIQTITGQDAVRAAGLQGASDANTQLAQFYLNEAKQMFPILSVDGGRKATVVIQSAVSLKWGAQDARFEQQYKPLNK